MQTCAVSTFTMDIVSSFKQLFSLKDKPAHRATKGKALNPDLGGNDLFGKLRSKSV